MDAPGPQRLLLRIRDRIRFKHYSIRTEQAYVDWIKRFIYFHDKRHPETMAEAEVNAFLTHLAVEGHVAALDPGPAQRAAHSTCLGRRCGWPVRRSLAPRTSRRF